MKKTYSKPALFAESFELSEHIALCSALVVTIVRLIIGAIALATS